MARHSRYLKMKRSIIALVYVLILVLMIMLYMLVRKAEHERKLHPEKYKTTASFEPRDANYFPQIPIAIGITAE